MADKTIGDLPAASAIYDDDLFLLEQSGEAKNLRGALYKAYLQGFVDAASAASEEAAAALAGVRDAINNIPEGAATPIVNDLTTGGTSMALSAEMGKKLKGELDGLTPEDIGALGIVSKYYNASANVSADELTDGLAVIALSATLNSDLYTLLSDMFAYVRTWFFSNASTTISRAQIAMSYKATNPKMVYRVYNANSSSWSGWREIATTDYAVPLDGSKAMTGTLTIAHASYPALRLNQSANGDNTDIYNGTHSVQIKKRNTTGSDANYRRIILYDSSGQNNLQNALQISDCVNGSEKWYNILHTGNKPSGSYTGNGSATSRTIETGGIGSVCAVFGYGGFAIVTLHGGIIRTTAGIIGLSQTEAVFANGVLTLATTNDVLNRNGSTAYYQVL